MAKEQEFVLPPLEERPLVTFALFAYNQEKYVREAIEGAFAQTYEPLEIILSDDCSTDRTFEIMEEMAARYRGPHKVTAKRGVRNVGIIDHVLSVSRDALGDLMVVAAGDDISYPNRVEELCKIWIKKRVAAIYSATDECNDDGHLIASDILPAPLIRIQDLFKGCSEPKKYSGSIRNIPGYSAAYRTEFLKKLPLTNNNANNEDALTTYLLNINGEEIEAIKKTLMIRRISISSISAKSNYQSIKDVERNEMVIGEFANSTLNFLAYFSTLRDFCKNHNDFTIVLNRLKYEIFYLRIVASFWEVGVFERLTLLARARRLKEIKYILPRLIGLRAFCQIKYFSAKK